MFDDDSCDPVKKVFDLIQKCLQTESTHIQLTEALDLN